MNFKKMLVLVGVLVIAAVVITACSTPGPEGPAGPAGPAGPQGEPGPAPAATDLTCTQCHNDTNIIAGKENSWASSVHGASADVFPGTTVNEYAGGRPSCNGCHSGSGFSDRVAQGIKTSDIKTADPNPSHIDCRACHQIHTTYTDKDWALETTAAYKFEAVDATFDGGNGNLCANCHQTRVPFPAATDGLVKVDSTHWGGHHGPEATLLLGVGGAGGVEGKPSAHYNKVEDTCVGCHMGGSGPDAYHGFMPTVATCQECHDGAKDFDVNGKQTEIKAKLEEVKAALIAKGLMDKDGVVVPGDYPEAQAAALWNYLLVEEDKSEGVHNMEYATALLDQALAALK